MCVCVCVCVQVLTGGWDQDQYGYWARNMSANFNAVQMDRNYVYRPQNDFAGILKTREEDMKRPYAVHSPWRTVCPLAVCVCVRVCVRVLVCVCVLAYMHVCECVRVRIPCADTPTTPTATQPSL